MLKAFRKSFLPNIKFPMKRFCNLQTSSMEEVEQDQDKEITVIPPKTRNPTVLLYQHLEIYGHTMNPKETSNAEISLDLDASDIKSQHYVFKVKEHIPDQEEPKVTSLQFNNKQNDMITAMMENYLSKYGYIDSKLRKKLQEEIRQKENKLKVDANLDYIYFNSNEALKDIRILNQNQEELIKIKAMVNIDLDRPDHRIKGKYPLPGGSYKNKRVCLITSKDNLESQKFNQTGVDITGDLVMLEKLLENKEEKPFEVLLVTNDVLDSLYKFEIPLLEIGIPFPSTQEDTVLNNNDVLAVSKFVSDIREGMERFNLEEIPLEEELTTAPSKSEAELKLEALKEKIKQYKETLDSVRIEPPKPNQNKRRKSYRRGVLDEEESDVEEEKNMKPEQEKNKMKRPDDDGSDHSQSGSATSTDEDDKQQIIDKKKLKDALRNALKRKENLEENVEEIKKQQEKLLTLKTYRRRDYQVKGVVGSQSFTNEQLNENINSFMSKLIDLKPHSVGGKFVLKVCLESNGRNYQINLKSLPKEKKLLRII